MNDKSRGEAKAGRIGEIGLGRLDWGDRNDKSRDGAKMMDGQFGTIEATAAATACFPFCTECSCRSESIRITVRKAKLASLFCVGGRKFEVVAGYNEKPLIKKGRSRDWNLFARESSYYYYYYYY